MRGRPSWPLGWVRAELAASSSPVPPQTPPPNGPVVRARGQQSRVAWRLPACYCRARRRSLEVKFDESRVRTNPRSGTRHYYRYFVSISYPSQGHLRAIMISRQHLVAAWSRLALHIGPTSHMHLRANPSHLRATPVRAISGPCQGPASDSGGLRGAMSSPISLGYLSRMPYLRAIMISRLSSQRRHHIVITEARALRCAAPLL